MTNAIRHSKAIQVALIIQFITKSSVLIRFCDNGQVFDMNTKAYAKGISFMHDRATFLNGQLTII